jgi:branched-chain amino acid transport system permease protein
VRTRAAALLAALLGAVALLFVAAGPAAAADTPITGTLTNDGKPVAGVEITVKSPDGFTKVVKSDATGQWKVVAPKGGPYTVSINTSTLPAGVSLTNPDKTSLTISAFDGFGAAVQFQLGADTHSTTGFFGKFGQLFVDGLIFGLVIALAGVGLSLVYGTTGLTNFSQGELITMGALATYFYNNVLGWDFILSAALAVLTCAVLGAVQDKILWKQLRRRGTGLIAMLVVSIGLGMFLRYVFLFLFGGNTKQFRSFDGQAGLELGPVSITPKSLIGTLVAVVFLAATAWWLLRTRMGKASRAVSDNPALASASGIDVERVINVVWFLGGGLAALSGILLAMGQGVNWQMGFSILLLVFAGVTVGGLGTAFGALVGSLVVGLGIELSTLWVPPELKSVIALLILILVLLVRPQGILGRAERIG